MRKILIISVIFLFLNSFFSCVVKKEYLVLEKKLNRTKKELFFEKKRNRALQFLFTDIAQKNDISFKDLLSTIEIINNDLQKNNLNLETEVDDLLFQLNKKDMIIAIQNMVINQKKRKKEKTDASLKTSLILSGFNYKKAEDSFIITFLNAHLFKQYVNVSRKGKKKLNKFSKILLSNKNYNISVNGHSDKTPIGKKLKERFPSNWHISSARAAAVTLFLQRTGISPNRLSSCGLSYYHPAASNKTKNGRVQNRRIEIILTPIVDFF